MKKHTWEEKTQLCPSCKTGRDTYLLDKRSSFCPYISYHNGISCPMFIPLEPNPSPVERTIKRGDMFYANLSHGIGSEQSGFRPILIIQNNIGNKYSNTVIVAVITSRTAKARIPPHCSIKAQQGLGHDSLVLLEQIRTIDKSRLKEYIGTLDSEAMSRVNKALAISVGLINCIK